MCGIVGYTGEKQAAPILLDGLKRLEYRGYDSAGLAVRDGDALAEVVKATGKLYHLADKTDQGRSLPGNCGIGHTRWATHGDPSLINAHPHVSGSCSGSGSGKVESDVVGVHNGIIENYGELKEKLLRHGYRFYSDTDTEVVVKLVDYYYKKYKTGPVKSISGDASAIFSACVSLAKSQTADRSFDKKLLLYSRAASVHWQLQRSQHDFGASE